MKRNQEVAAAEREKKVHNAMVATEKKEEAEAAKRAVRDANFSSRYAPLEKAKIMGMDMHAAAEQAGVTMRVPPPPPSPYGLAMYKEVM